MSTSTLLWLVKAPFSETAPVSGLLQQSYVADAKPRSDQIPALIGEVSAAIVLQSTANNIDKVPKHVRNHPQKFLSSWG